MVRFAIAVVTLAAALTAAAPAGADPDILTPNCSSGQVPQAGECKPERGDVAVDDAPGPNPDVPLGLNPENVPAV